MVGKKSLGRDVNTWQFVTAWKILVMAYDLADTWAFRDYHILFYSSLTSIGLDLFVIGNETAFETPTTLQSLDQFTS